VTVSPAHEPRRDPPTCRLPLAQVDPADGGNRAVEITAAGRETRIPRADGGAGSHQDGDEDSQAERDVERHARLRQGG
jgi:hypothetical protein